MQQQQQLHFEENFEDLTLGEETKMDVQEEERILLLIKVFSWP